MLHFFRLIMDILGRLKKIVKKQKNKTTTTTKKTKTKENKIIRPVLNHYFCMYCA